MDGSQSAGSVLARSRPPAYLNLNAAEEQRFNRSLAEAKLLPEQREEVVEIVTSCH